MTLFRVLSSRDVNMADDQPEENQEIEEDDVSRPVFVDGMVRLFSMIRVFIS